MNLVEALRILFLLALLGVIILMADRVLGQFRSAIRDATGL